MDHIHSLSALLYIYRQGSETYNDHTNKNVASIVGALCMFALFNFALIERFSVEETHDSNSEGHTGMSSIVEVRTTVLFCLFPYSYMIFLSSVTYVSLSIVFVFES